MYGVRPVRGRMAPKTTARSPRAVTGAATPRASITPDGPPGTRAQLRTVAVDDAGRIVAAGWVKRPDIPAVDFLVVRYDVAGRLASRVSD
jgi:hypothetical protein